MYDFSLLAALEEGLAARTELESAISRYEARAASAIGMEAMHLNEAILTGKLALQQLQQTIAKGQKELQRRKAVNPITTATTTQPTYRTSDYLDDLDDADRTLIQIRKEIANLSPTPTPTLLRIRLTNLKNERSKLLSQQLEITKHLQQNLLEINMLELKINALYKNGI